ncbi:hypothetical protein ACIQAD_27100 [Streptomyces sp. NPDC088551]|uniref:hypothetical protein n=1 Tax=Streptomyces sp. NPDC088551 TaxID=3365863 RepID=UPI0037FCF8FB
MTGHEEFGEFSRRSAYSDNWQRLIDMTGGVPAPRGGGGGDGGGAGEGGGPGLRHSGGPWIRAAGAAEALRTHMGPVRAEFAAAHEGLAAGTEGLGVAAVLRTVRGSWERRIEAAMGECGSLAGQLRAVAKDVGETDEAIAATFAKATGGGGR